MSSNPIHGKVYSIQYYVLCTPVSSTFKIDCHDLTEILLKVELNTINLNQIYSSMIRLFLEGVIALFHSEYFIIIICTGNFYILNLNFIKTCMLAIMICKLLLVIEWTILKEILPKKVVAHILWQFKQMFACLLTTMFRFAYHYGNLIGRFLRELLCF